MKHIKKSNDLEIPVTIAGVRFRNPFYVSSGPTTMTIEQLEKIEQYGWGGASLKLTFDPTPYINLEPRYGYYPDKGFLAFTAEKRLKFDELLKLIEQGRKRTKEIILFSNITYSGEKGIDGWVNMARKCEEAGVHINELNLGCPNMSYNLQLTGKKEHEGPKTGASLGQDKDAVAEIVKAVKANTKIPVFVKLSPEGGKIAEVAESAISAGADAVGTNANRLAIPPINLDAPTKSMYYLQKEISIACMNGPWLKPLALRDVYEMRLRVGPNAIITGTGGVTTWKDAVEMIMCGADLIGICTATLVYGFSFMPEFIRGFKEHMKNKGYKHPREMRDIVLSAITPSAELTIYPGHAELVNSRLVAPCVDACPNSVPAQGYVRKVSEGKIEEAYQLIMSRSPLQAICGKVCDHPCEKECTRGLKDEPIMIREIKRFVLETAKKNGWSPYTLPSTKNRNRKKVAIIGSGPAGLACAYDLVRAGYQVTVYEKNKIPGGMLTSCIPSFRISQNDINYEIKLIEKLGVKFKTGVELGKDFTLVSLKKDKADAIFVGIGAWKPIKPQIHGVELQGNLTAIDFLKQARDMRSKIKLNGKRVAVIGGGFTAVDSARVAIRLKAKEVFILYRRTRNEMRASEEEISEAEQEGVKIMYLVAPVEVIGTDRVERIRMVTHVLGPVDKSGRRSPQSVPETYFTLKIDTIIWALGQQVPSDNVNELKLTADGLIQTDQSTCATSIEGIFAGGDCSRGPATVITAIADGKRAAVSIDKYLGGNFLQYDAEKTVVDKEEVLTRTGNIPRKWRPSQELIPATKRKHNFREYRKTLSAEEAIQEAQRCLACGCGAGCEICVDICKMFAWSVNDTAQVVIDVDKCVACGMCVYRCPNKNIKMIRTSDTPIHHNKSHINKHTKIR